MATNKTAADNYDESSFRVLKGLEPVRERPGMYTRTENPLHILQEVIDNAADEALAGFAKTIHVTFLDDGAIVIEDNGRGIPVGMHPEEKVSVVELAFTRLHAGGKFNKKDGGAYAFAGGLHGVGVAVTTALSHKVIVEIRREGKVHQIEFTDGGRQIGKVREIGTCNKSSTGTKVTVWPDAKYFQSPKIPMAELERLLRSKAVFLKKVSVSLTVEGETKTWDFPGGLSQYLGELIGASETVAPIYVGEKFIEADVIPESGANTTSTMGSFSPGEGASFAVAWVAEGAGVNESYVNLIPTGGGGTHESGLKAGIFESVKAFVEHHGLLPRGVKLQQEDVSARMSYVLAAKVLDPEFQGQTKDRLNSRPAHKLLMSVSRDPFESWLNTHVEHGKAIAELAIKQALSRQKNGQKVEKKKSSGLSVLPGKLSDCEATEDNEIFMVEGDSAGGSAKMARNRENQAILPLRGKVLNTWEVEPGRLFANQEVHDISVAIGVEPHGVSDGTAKMDNKDNKDVLANLRYERVIIMTDADVDGSHIQTLLCTLFYRHFPKLVEMNHLFIALSPLYRIDVAAVGKGKPARRFYALDEKERDALLEKLRREGVPTSKIEIGRFKGLGEMNATQLKETSMDPATRRVLPVRYNPDDAKEVNAIFELLMGESGAASRREWMARKGSTVEADA
jgi:topoisomerase IV subunit B